MRLPLLVAASLLPLLAGCQRDNHPRLPDDDPVIILPGAGPSAISTVGGHAQSRAGRSAGDSGSIILDVSGGRVLLDDGRARVFTGPNFIDLPLQEDGVVTYTELEAAQAPVIAGGVATFDVAALGAFLFDDVRLDLSDAPTTGTPVDTVEIIAGGPVRIEGNIRTARPDADAVSLRLIATGNFGISIDGGVNTSAVNGFSAGNVEIMAPNGPVIAQGRIRAEGGPATDTSDGGSGGNVSIAAGNGDLILRSGAWNTFGLEGQVNGGRGGDILLTTAGAGAVEFRWSLATRGGRGVDGDGGDAGGVFIGIDAAVRWFTRLELGGGASANFDAGIAPGATLEAQSHTGTIRVQGDGGRANNGQAGDAASLLIGGVQIDDLHLEVNCRGGAGDQGGAGGNIALNVDAGLDDCDLQVWAHGGSGAAQGGNGGSCYINASMPALMQNFLLQADVRGGGSQGQGGVGGSAGCSTAAGAQISNAVLEIHANGGGGDVGGSGGTAEVFIASGSAWGRFHARANGGSGDTGAGGSGGTVALFSPDGSIDFDISGSANGGDGSIGGPGGIFSIGSDVGSASGSARLLGSFEANGGDGDTTGGAGGTYQISGGDGGVTLEKFEPEANGGQGDTGGVGGALVFDSAGPVSASGGVLQANGGGGTAGGSGGSISFSTRTGGVLLAAILHAQGGAGGGAGGSFTIATDSDGSGAAGSVIQSGGTISVRGGAGGGMGGTIVVDATAVAGASGSITIAGTLLATGGDGGAAAGGSVLLTTDGPVINISGHVNVTGGAADGNGGTIDVTAAQQVTVAGTGRLIADGRGAGVAGFITLDPAGAGPNNPALAIHPGATVRTSDGDGTDQSATNVVLD